MLRRFLPYQINFFDFFNRHAHLITQSAMELQTMMSQPQNIFHQAEMIHQIEHQADRVTHQCVEALHKTFITPFEREDIHHLISKMDDIIDEIETVAHRISLYKFQTIKEEARELAEIVAQSVQEVEDVVNLLQDFKSQEIRAKCVSINQLENHADHIFNHSLAKLFENEVDPLSIMKWKEIYEHLENATDRCEDVANIIEGIVLEHE